MAKEVIGTSPSTGEVLVRDTDTDEWTWEVGTEEQIESVTADIVAAGDYGTVTYQEYEPPAEPKPEPKPVPPEKQKVYVAPTTSAEQDILATAETTGGYFGVEALTWIIERLNWLSEYFYSIYLEVYSWVAPFSYVAYLFYFASSMFSQLAWGFYSFSEWVYDTAERVAKILSWETIWSYIKSYIPNLEAIRDWFYYWRDYTLDVISDWWTSVKAWWQAQLDELSKEFNQLQVQWDYFWTVLYPQSVNWDAFLTWWNGELLELQSFIDSAFSIRSNLWDGWQELREKITDFIADPAQWFYDRLDEIFERFW